MKAFLLLVVGVSSVVVIALYPTDSRRAAAQSGTRVASEPFEAKLWTYLKRVQYKNWAPAPGQNGGFYPGESPHGAFLKMYLNREAMSNAKSPPHGSVIIKENYGKDKKTLMAVTVMARYKDYNPDGNDWYWVKYKPDGTVDRKGEVALAGKVKGCISCHDGAAGDDFLFINDE